MDSNPRTRRAALKKIGLGSTALLAGVSGIPSVGAAKNEHADFDPYNLSEVGDFAEEYVVKKRIEKPGTNPMKYVSINLLMVSISSVIGRSMH